MIVLWVCMIISFGMFAVFYYKTVIHSQDVNAAETSWMLNWVYILFAVCLVFVCFFSFCRFIRLWKTNRKLLLYSLVIFVFLGLLLGGSYMLGNGDHLNVLGYEGVENTFYWLKIIDMWIYSISFLLVVTLVVIIIGIIQSSINKG